MSKPIPKYHHLYFLNISANPLPSSDIIAYPRKYTTIKLQWLAQSSGMSPLLSLNVDRSEISARDITMAGIKAKLTGCINRRLIAREKSLGVIADNPQMFKQQNILVVREKGFI